jgi:hypothetical protein
MTQEVRAMVALMDRLMVNVTDFNVLHFDTQVRGDARAQARHQ